MLYYILKRFLAYIRFTRKSWNIFSKLDDHFIYDKRLRAQMTKGVLKYIEKVPENFLVIFALVSGTFLGTIGNFSRTFSGTFGVLGYALN